MPEYAPLEDRRNSHDRYRDELNEILLPYPREVQNRVIDVCLKRLRDRDIVDHQLFLRAVIGTRIAVIAIDLDMPIGVAKHRCACAAQTFLEYVREELAFLRACEHIAVWAEAVKAPR